MKKRALSLALSAALVTSLTVPAMAADPGYGDVDSEAAYAQAVQTVTDAGLMNGVGAGIFAPDQTVTLAQAVTVVGRLKNVEAEMDQADTWYGPYLKWATDSGLLEDSGLAPNVPVTSSQLDDLFEKVAAQDGKDYINFPAVQAETVTRSDLAQRLVKLMNAPENYDYEGKEMWFDTTIYGGFYSAYQIMQGAGDDTFDIAAFVNSKQGELIINRSKYELVLLGEDQYASQEMIDYWAENGVVETAYESDDPEHEWLTFVPDYMYDEENKGKSYPVVFCFHGNENTLFMNMNLGFVEICYDEGFIVVAPEMENSDSEYAAANLEGYLDKMEELGYPIDRTRVYTGGMSKGGRLSLYLAQQFPDVIAAASGHGCSFALDPSAELSMFAEDKAYEAIPLYMAIGESDMNQLPMSDVVVSGLNKWANAFGCGDFIQSDNMLSIEGDETYTEEIDGTTYTFADMYDADGNNVMKIVAIEGLPHWISYSYAKLAWDFMSQFSIVDGQRVCS